MGCGASKDVVDTQKSTDGNKSPSPEKAPNNITLAKDPVLPVISAEKHNHQDIPAGEVPSTKIQPAANTAPDSPAQGGATPAQPPTDGTHPPSNPPPSNAHPPATTQPTPASPAPSSTTPSSAPNPEKKPEEHKTAEKLDEKEKEKPVSTLPSLNLGSMTDRKKATLLEFDMGAPATPSAASKTAVQERLEKYAEERKVGVLRPSSASLERRLADADSRRKQQAEQKVKKAKYTNELAKDKYSELREAEEKKTQELMQLIKNKNMQAANKRNQMQQEVKAKAEEDVVKARELSARRKEGGGSTPDTPKTPHTPSTPGTPHGNESEEKPAASILEVPLPPLK